MMKRIIYLFIFCCSVSGFAQELNCAVSVTSTPDFNATANDKEILEDMEKNIEDFMNNTSWTKDIFEIEERINCNISIIIRSKQGNDGFGGQIQIQSSRPVYNTSYNTTVFNHIDKDFDIVYLRNTALLFSIDRYRSNLTSVLAFYAYMILGYDYDSYSLEGGTAYFNKAQQIANNAKHLTGSGWDPNKKGIRDTRYYIVDNAIQSLHSPLRDTYYKYHRLGFDLMYSDIENARKTVLQSIKALDRVKRSRPNSINLQIFFNSKSEEIISLFSQADSRTKQDAVNVLKRLDPINASKYQAIL